MSLKLELIAVEFPVGYPLELVKTFMIAHDKIKFNEKLHFKNFDTNSQIILQNKKFIDFVESKTVKHQINFGDEEFQHTATLIFSTENPDISLVKMAPRGSKVSGTPTGRGHRSVKACESCITACNHNAQ